MTNDYFQTQNFIILIIFNILIKIIFIILLTIKIYNHINLFLLSKLMYRKILI